MKKFKPQNAYLPLALLLAVFMAGCGSSDHSSTPAADDTSAPTVVLTAPAADAVDVARNSKVVATFSEAMDATTIDDTTSFTVIGADEPALTGSVSLDAASNTAIFTPNSKFTASTLYTATITTAAKSSAGVALADDYVWSFTAGTTTDAVAPTVSSTDPIDGATEVALNRNVSANFSEALDPATVNTSTFTLCVGDTVGGTPVPGAVSYNTKVATFNPDSNLTSGIDYTANLTTAITDLMVPANHLAAAKEWTFTTGDAVADGPDAVNLLTAGDFAILSKAGVTNVPISDITGNIGASPISAASIGVTCGEVTGTIYGADAAYTGSGGDVSCFAGLPADNTLVANAVLDMGTAYADAKGRTTPDFTELGAGEIGGLDLEPGLYKWTTDVNITTDVTLSGGPNDVWIFQISRDLIQANDASVILDGGALPKNIFWQVGGGTGVAIGTAAHLEGVVLAAAGITVNTGASVNGRLFAHTAVTLQVNAITEP